MKRWRRFHGQPAVGILMDLAVVLLAIVGLQLLAAVLLKIIVP
jgi:hypothetical protein